MHEQEQTRWDLLLLFSLLLVILMYPVLDHDEIGRLILGALVFVPAVSATIKLSKIRFGIWPSVLLVSGAIIAAVASIIFNNQALTGIKWGIMSAFFGVTVVGLFNYFQKARSVRSAHLYTAVSIYLLIGMLWFALYTAIDIFRPDSFLHSSSAAADRQSDLLYFSLVTLSTVGYGDIVPLQGEVRMLAALEGITGVLYIAITVALLVSAYKQRSNPS